MNVNESAENYLETILRLSKKLPVVRSVDIANELGFKKSSVSVAMKNLRQKEHITVTDAGFIYLTEEGKAIAEHVYEKHQLLKGWLCSLGVPEEIAAEELEEAKKIKIRENDRVRDLAINGGVTYKNVLFDSDTDSEIIDYLYSELRVY